MVFGSFAIPNSDAQASDVAVGLAFGAHCPATGEHALLVSVWDKAPIFALAVDVIPEGPQAAVEQASRRVVALHVPNALADPIALVLGDGRQDRENQLADAVAGDVAAQVDHVQRDLVLFQLLQRAQRVGRGAERAVKLRRDDDITGLHRSQEPPRGQWDTVKRSQIRRAKLFSPSAAYRASRHFSYWAARAL